jgi:hypothetical protein
MHSILSQNQNELEQIRSQGRCICIKQRTIKKPSKGKPLEYPDSDKVPLVPSTTFQMTYKQDLSTTAKCILNNLRNKYIYYAIDDILYLLKSKPVERDNLLAVLYSPILSLQNNFSVNFFDIWIREVYIDEISKNNKFLKTDSPTLKQCNYITIEFYYRIGVPAKKEEPLW